MRLIAPGTPGQELVAASGIGTAVFVIGALGATAFPDELARPMAVVDLLLFAGGIVAFLWSYFLAIERSRTEAIGMGGLYFLAGDTAPADVRRALLLFLGVQVMVGVGTAWMRIYTPLAFGVLVPMFGLGLAGLWGARHGRFSPR